jgi:hypothetical protein
MKNPDFRKRWPVCGIFVFYAADQNLGMKEIFELIYALSAHFHITWCLCAQKYKILPSGPKWAASYPK